MVRDDYEPVPAIVREVSEKDDPTYLPKRVSMPFKDKIISQPTDKVSYNRGMGNSGYRVQVVKHDCPAEYCNFDRMVRRVDISPVSQNEVRYWCLNPNCVHYVRDSLSYACHGNYPQRDVDEPMIFGD